MSIYDYHSGYDVETIGELVNNCLMTGVTIGNHHTDVENAEFKYALKDYKKSFHKYAQHQVETLLDEKNLDETYLKHFYQLKNQDQLKILNKLIDYSGRKIQKQFRKDA